MVAAISPHRWHSILEVHQDLAVEALGLWHRRVWGQSFSAQGRAGDAEGGSGGRVIGTDGAARQNIELSVVMTMRL